jgi:hypothetical protein
MPTTPTMFAVVRPDGYGKRQFVSVPYVSALLEPLETPRRYFTLSDDEPAPPPAPEPPRTHGPRRTFRMIGPPLDE